MNFTSRMALLIAQMRGYVRAVAPVAIEPRRPRAWRALLADRFVRVLILSSGLVTLCAAMMNVGELVLAKEDLRAGATGFAMLVSVYGVGLVIGVAVRRPGRRRPAA